MEFAGKTFKYFFILLGIIWITNALAATNTPTTTTKQTSSQQSATSSKTKTTDKKPESDIKKLQNQAYSIMSSLTPDQRSALQDRMEKEDLVTRNPFGIVFYKPNYVLPFYYTGKPYQSVYKGSTPDDQKVMSSEFKAQLSLRVPVWKNMFGSKNSSLNLAFTELFYWQFYTKSQYFRETDYEPEIFIRKQLIPNWWINFGAVHQSNGKGGDLERSWNRAYMDLMFSNANWMVSIKPWVLIFTDESSNLHNPDIAKYLGYGRMVLAYKIKRCTASLMMRNLLASGFGKSTFEFNFSFPIYGPLKGYVQAFSGYGQSLIEYDHYTNSIGIGLTISDWI